MKPSSSSFATREPLTVCPADHTTLRGDGWCATGQGYPLEWPCPFACPMCRGPLSWDGGCERCHGCTTGERVDWTFPGDRYDTHDDDGQPLGDGRHWVKIDGPRAVLPPDQAKEQAQLIARVLARMGPLDVRPDPDSRRARMGLPPKERN